MVCEFYLKAGKKERKKDGGLRGDAQVLRSHSLDQALPGQL